MSEVAVLPKYPIPGLEHLDPDDAALRLHNKKNRAVRPEDDMEFPPYRFRPFPCALYRDWNEVNRRAEIRRRAVSMGVSLDDDRGMQHVEDAIEPFETLLCGVLDHDAEDAVISQLRERNEKELNARLEQGWATTPDGVRAAKDRLNKAVALHAAERAFDDRRLGEHAKAELERLEDAADDHVVEVPEANKKGQRPGKG